MMTENITLKKNSYRIKIFGPLSNKKWLEEKINLWLEENNVTIQQISMTYSEDKYILTLLYLEKN